jgi:restriction system protein
VAVVAPSYTPVAVGVGAALLLTAAWWLRPRRSHPLPAVGRPAQVERLRVPAMADAARAELLLLHHQDFEILIAELLKERGYRDVVVFGGPGDGGVDVAASERSGQGVVAQCKRYGNGSRVGTPEMRQFLGTIHNEPGEPRGIFATTTAFVPEAASIADRHGIELVDGEAILSNLGGRRPSAVVAASTVPVVDRAALIAAGAAELGRQYGGVPRPRRSPRPTPSVARAVPPGQRAIDSLPPAAADRHATER